ncbi:hypothetical protein ASD8599_02310 [Ascidiaceihabitans donghaensis]|uniref:PhoU domain-containing protein n=1 Tax=Ascidiaceihabitans donghaensis TaxID=1510460 RepID=A0A2R8BEQ0_9RHOB|nr:hypothetical protein ASD8599_02310 [Ascidiaceihabitans donghaensis]
MHRDRCWSSLKMKDHDPNSEVQYLLTVLGRMAQHVANLSKTLTTTEDFMTEHFHVILSKHPNAMEDFQRLDFLNQSIMDTSRLLCSLSEGCTDPKQLVQDLHLASTQHLVCPVASEKMPEDGTGDVNLF